MKNNSRGKISEFIARIYFRLKGYKVVTKNYVTGKGTHAGEIDFIACKKKTLVFVEVKERTSLEKAAYALRAEQQMRIRKAAENFIAKHQKYDGFDYRFDAVFISFPLKIEHLENAF